MTCRLIEAGFMLDAPSDRSRSGDTSLRWGLCRNERRELAPAKRTGQFCRMNCKNLAPNDERDLPETRDWKRSFHRARSLFMNSQTVHAS
jgi:hypothetical protein